MKLVGSPLCSASTISPLRNAPSSVKRTLTFPCAAVAERFSMVGVGREAEGRVVARRRRVTTESARTVWLFYHGRLYLPQRMKPMRFLFAAVMLLFPMLVSADEHRKVVARWTENMS